MSEDHVKYDLYPGRWVPFHNGHAAIIRRSLDAGHHVCIGIRATAGEAFTPEERKEMIEAVYADEPRVVVDIMRDIRAICVGRQVGYEIVRYEMPDDIEGISATEIRRLIAEGDDSWRAMVPSAVAQHLAPSPRGYVIWMTGLSGSGKTTIAELVADWLPRAVLIDGDVIREGLCRGLGFSREDRIENLRRLAWAARLVADGGAVAVVAAISPYEEAREAAREIVGPGRFSLVWINTPLSVCEERDPKGLYAKVRAGEIKGFTGIDDPYERPVGRHIEILPHLSLSSVCAEKLIKCLPSHVWRGRI